MPQKKPTSLPPPSRPRPQLIEKPNIPIFEHQGVRGSPSGFRPSLPGGKGQLPDPKQVGSPLFLHTSITLAANETRAPEVIKLQAPGMFLLKEIRFVTQVTKGSVYSSNYSPGTAIGVDFILGRNVLTANPVPIGVLDRSRLRAAEYPVNKAGTINYGGFSLRLKHPLLLLPGEVLAPTFTHFGTIATTIPVKIAYLGWLLPPSYPRPIVRRVPWFAPYLPTVVSLSGTETSQTSGAKDLANPHDVPVYVERIMGRLYRAVSGSSSGFLETDDTDATNALWRQTKIRVEDSLGNRVVRQDTYFYNVFSYPSASLELEHILPPGAFYTLQLKCGGTAVTDGLGLAQFSLNGWREVPL